MSFKGDLSTIGLAEVFQMISMSQKEGTLVVDGPNGRKCIFFSQSGVRLLSTGKRKSLRVGDMLVRAGKVTEDQLDEALETAKIRRQRLGEILIEEGVLTEQDINSAIRVQIEEEIYDLFLWTRANYEFIEGPPDDSLIDPAAHEIELSFDVNGLLLEAVRRADEWIIINRKVPSLESIFVWLTEEGRDAEFDAASDSLKRLFQHIDGETSVSGLVDVSGMGDFEVCHCLAGLVDREFIRVLSPQELMEMASERMEDGRRDAAMKIYQSVAHQAPEDPKVSSRIARTLDDEGLTREAALSHVAAGRLYMRKGESERAMEHFQRAEAASPDDPEVQFGLFEAYSGEGNHEEARRVGQELVAMWQESEEHGRARSLCDKILMADPTDLEFRVQRAKVLHQMDLIPELEEDLVYIRSNMPESELDRKWIESEFREMGIEEDQAPAIEKKFGTSPSRAARRRPIRVKRLLLVLGAMGLVAGVIYAVMFEMEASRVYEAMEPEVRAFLEKGEFEQARGALLHFLESHHAYSPIQAGYARSLMAEVAEKEGQKRKKERLERERLVKEALKVIEGLIKEIEAGWTQNPDLALKRTESLRELAEKWDLKEYLDRAEKYASTIGTYRSESNRLQEEAVALEKIGEYAKACAKLSELIRTYPNTAAGQAARYPLAITTRPKGVTVTSIALEERLIGVTGEGPLVHRMRPTEPVKLRFERVGYVAATRPVSNNRIGSLHVDLTLKLSEWDYPLGFKVSWPMAHVNGVVLVAHRNYVIFMRADAAKTAGIAQKLDGLVRGGLCVSGELAYVGTDEGWVYAIDPIERSKRVLWKVRLNAALSAGPCISADGKTLYVGTVGGKLHALDAKTGQPRWTTPAELPSSARVEPVMVGKRLVVACEDGTLLALTGPGEKERTILYRLSLAPGPMSVAGSVVYVPSRLTLHALDVNQPGKPTWSRRFHSEVSGRVVRVGSLVFVAPRDGPLKYLDAGTGAERGAFEEAEGPIEGGVVAAGSLVLFSGKDKGGTERRIYAFDATERELHWRFRIEDSTSAPCLLGDGRVFFSAGEQLYSIVLN